MKHEDRLAMAVTLTAAWISANGQYDFAVIEKALRLFYEIVGRVDGQEAAPGLGRDRMSKLLTAGRL
jgi:hypothetical protein